MQSCWIMWLMLALRSCCWSFKSEGWTACSNYCCGTRGWGGVARSGLGLDGTGVAPWGCGSSVLTRAGANCLRTKVDIQNSFFHFQKQSSYLLESTLENTVNLAQSILQPLLLCQLHNVFIAVTDDDWGGVACPAPWW